MPPPPKHRGREAAAGMPPPEHRMKAQLVGSGSRGGALAAPEHRLKPPLVGSDSSGGAMAPPERRGKGMGSSAGSRGKPAATSSKGETPLANLSNLIGSPGFPIKEPPTTAIATQLQRFARERRYTMPWSPSSPRDPSVGMGQQRRSANTCRNTAAAAAADSFRDSATKLRPLQKPGTGLSGGRSPSASLSGARMPRSPSASSSGARMPSSPSVSSNCARMPRSPSARLSGARMPRNPSTSLSGARMPSSPSASSSGARTPWSPSTSLSGTQMLPSPRMMVKAGTGLSIETSQKHQAATSSPQKRAVTGSPQKHWAVTGSPQKQQIVTGSPQKQQTVTGSPQKHRAVTGSPQKHRAVTGSPQKQQTVTGSPQKQQIVPGSPHKHQAVTSSNTETAQSVTGSNGETPQKHHTKVTEDGRSSGEMRRKKYRKEKIAPSQTIRQPSSLQRAETITERPTIREKQQQKSTSEELTAEEKRRLTEEMAKKVQEADHVIQQLNKLGLGEDISNEELQHYFEQLPSEPPRVDTSLELDDKQIRKLQVHHVLCLIKYHKMTQQGHKNDLCDATLEDDYPLYHLEEKLKWLEEDKTKLEGDHILDYLDKEGLLMYFEKDDIFGWSFQYRAVATLDDYQRLVPENYGGCEYVHWNVYRKYFHKYEIELEYLDFWEELSKNLKWLESYIDIEWSSLKWRRICSRGESQAIKIATGFKNITSNLAHAAYYDLIDSMNVEFCWYKELDGVYFEIWKQVTKLKKSFREALEVVYKLGKFSLRQHVMEHALQTNDFEMEKQFRNCIEGIPEEVTEEKARELIADAITKLRDRPKFYAQYIRKKIEIARAVGVIPSVALI